MNIIETTEALELFTRELRQRPFVAVDTEFMRERTYWPILCLVQAAAEGIEAIIDPLAPDLDLAPFLELMNDERVVKVFHAARQDVEIFHRLTGAVPSPLFDTQVAAMACGFGDQVGYEALVRGLVGAKIDKGSRFTDWARRPLSSAQLNYALCDVTHLRDAYPKLLGRLEKDGRQRWVAEEMQALTDPSLYSVAPADAWERLKLRGVKPADLGPIVKLAEWREREAQARDLPRGRVLKDDAIFEIARLKPVSTEQLAEARSIGAGFERSRAGQAIIEAVAAGKATPRDSLPKLEDNERRAIPPADVVDLLRVLLKRQCERFNVAPKLVATMTDLEKLAIDPTTEIPAVQGWRREVFGDIALRMMRGEVALRLVRGALDVVDTTGQSV